jgi:hypothetical protein
MENKYEPYCPVCSGCGEEGCCSPLICDQSPDGHYCGSYLKYLKFTYKINQYFEENICDKMSEELIEQYNTEWNKLWDEFYPPREISVEELGKVIKEQLDGK